jgi:Secretion system C-terminal sorting domain/Kelch motif
MKKFLPKLNHAGSIAMRLCFMMLFAFTAQQNFAQTGIWTSLTNHAPDFNLGGMILLSDGTVLCKTSSGGTDGYGNIYDKLTPDINGSYANGTWSRIAPMLNTRLYYSSQVLKDGRVYVCGGEYGTGGSSGETYDPLTNKWTAAPAPGGYVSDANSEILDDGRLIQAIVQGSPFLKQTKYYDPSTNTYSAAPSTLGYHNESAWVKLPDGSILFVDRGSTSSERYIPATGTWIADATVPVSLYDPWGLESGGALLLPNGHAFFIGSLGHCAIYTPSGTTSPGTWTATADIPNGQGTPDAAAAMMINGKVLLATSPVPTSANHFPTPTSYYEYDYTTNTFTRVGAPGGGLTTNISSYLTNMICLPNGQILLGIQGSNQYYVYTPSGSQVTTQKPVITSVGVASPGVYRLVGTGFNGISEGATYGDDWQMATNYPIIRLTSGTTVHYARTFNWNHTGVRTGTLKDTVFFTVKGVAHGTYSLVVTANGISSDPKIVSGAPVSDLIASSSESLNSGSKEDISTSPSKQMETEMYPNPAKDHTTIQFTLGKTSHVDLKVLDMNGKELIHAMNGDMEQGAHSITVNTGNLAAGLYNVRIITESGIKNLKLVVQ